MPRRASSRSNLQNRETRERILAAAAEVLSEDGVVGVSTRRVAERAGANQALIHYYFESIDNLMWQVVKQIAERAVASREARYNNDNSFITNWRADIAALLGGSEESRQETKVWFEGMAVVLNTPELRDEHLRHRARTREVMRGAIRRELEAARPGEDLDEEVDTLATLASTVRSGLSIDRLLGSEGLERTEEMLDIIEGLLRDRLEVPKAKRRPTPAKARRGSIRAERSA
jgi:AcrR family transcriptional regulator